MRGKREMKRGKLERERGGRRGKERKQKKKKGFRNEDKPEIYVWL